MNHTREPWTAKAVQQPWYEIWGPPDDQGFCQVIGTVLRQEGAEYRNPETEEAWSTAQRIVSCVNGCATVANPEAVPELLECLQAITLAAYIDCPHNDAWKNLIETCRAAIALAEKEDK